MHGFPDRLQQDAVPVVGEAHPLLVDARAALDHGLTVVFTRKIGKLLVNKIVIGLAYDLRFFRAK